MALLCHLHVEILEGKMDLGWKQPIPELDPSWKKLPEFISYFLDYPCQKFPNRRYFGGAVVEVEKERDVVWSYIEDVKLSRLK